MVKCLYTYNNKFNLELISSLKATANTKLLNNDNNDVTVHWITLWLSDYVVTRLTHFVLT